MNGDTTITVSYTEKGITLQDSFVVTVNLPALFKADIYNSSNKKIGMYDTDVYTFNTGYDYDDISYMVITGYTGSSKVVVFPNNIGGYNVKKIGKGGYYSKDTFVSGIDEVENIVISDGIEEIGS